MTDISQHTNPCAPEINTDCLVNCDISQYYDTQYKICIECDSGCFNCSTFGTCNLCSDIKCNTCSLYQSSCDATISDPCLPGLFYNALNQCCRKPCLTCYMSSNNYCLSCDTGYLLYGQTCVLSCPYGYNRILNSCIKSNIRHYQKYIH